MNIIKNDENLVRMDRYQNKWSWKNKMARMLWNIVYNIIFKNTPIVLFFNFRNNLLRIFGAKIGLGVRIYPSSKIWAPWNLNIGDYSWIGPETECYNVDMIIIGNHVTISQYAFLCTASHDISSRTMVLIKSPIIIQDGAWIAARAYIGPGVKVGVMAVVGANTTITKNIDPFNVMVGSPARCIKIRKIIG